MKLTKNYHGFLIFLFFNFFAYFPDLTFPNCVFKFLILNLTCFYLNFDLFFLSRNIIIGLFLFFYSFVFPPFFSFGLCLNFYFNYGFLRF
jgi:hypothetical protein